MSFSRIHKWIYSLHFWTHTRITLLFQSSNCFRTPKRYTYMRFQSKKLRFNKSNACFMILSSPSTRFLHLHLASCIHCTTIFLFTLRSTLLRASSTTLCSRSYLFFFHATNTSLLFFCSRTATHARRSSKSLDVWNRIFCHWSRNLRK